MPPLTQLLAETGPQWAEAIAPVAERVARALLGEEMPTPLTQTKRSAGRRQARKRPARASRPSRAAASCTVCGAELGKGQRRYCAGCRPQQSRDAVSKAHAALRAKRVAGADPAHGGEAARKRGRRTAAMLRANAEWERKHGEQPDPATFTAEILPRLMRVPLAEMSRATGLSRPYCGMIRRGDRVPHPQHWNKLTELGR